MKRTVLVTGANRGIGLEFVRQYAAADCRVFACCRQPDAATELKGIAGDVSLHALEVTDADQITALAKALEGERIDVLINNAGVYGPRDASFNKIDYDQWVHTFQVNTMAPLAMTQCFLQNLALCEHPVVASVTSKMGSIADNTSGGAYIYRSSKAALNMVNKSMAHDLAPHGFICVVLHPGWVETDMGGPNALINTLTSVSGMRKTIDGLTPEDAGNFYNYDGSLIAW